MSEKTTAADQAATVQELTAAFPDAGADFHIAQLRAGATMVQATTAFIAHQNEALKAAQNEAESAKKDAEKAREEAANAKAAASMPGNDEKGQDSDEDAQEGFGADPISKWHEEIDALVASGMDRIQAATRVDASYPGLREAMLAARKLEPGLEQAADGVYAGVLR